MVCASSLRDRSLGRLRGARSGAGRRVVVRGLRDESAGCGVGHCISSTGSRLRAGLYASPTVRPGRALLPRQREPQMSEHTGTPPRLRSRRRRPGEWINHLALVTDDMDATVRFYHGALGARLVATIGTPELPALLLRVRSRVHSGVLRVQRPRARAVGEAGGHPRIRWRHPVRPPLVQRARRGGAARPAAPAEGARLRGHRRRRPLGSSGRSTSPTPTASRSRRRGGCSTRPADRRTTATTAQFADPDPGACACESSPSVGRAVLGTCDSCRRSASSHRLREPSTSGR